MEVKKPRKKYPRQTTVRFNTEEAKVILMAMNYAKNRGDIFTHEGPDSVFKAYSIMAKLKFRIEEERKKRDKILVEIKDENPE
jgi:hypothetical protein